MTGVRERMTALFEKTSTAALVQSAMTLESVDSPNEQQRMVTAWTLDEIERRSGKITDNEAEEFERMWDTTGSYLLALMALRPSLEA